MMPLLRWVVGLALVAAGAAAAASACPPFSVADGSGECTLCDCDGACFSAGRLEGWPGDGTCNSRAPNLDCWAFESDGGDCASSSEGPAPDAVLAENVFRGAGVAVDASEMGG
jgi:hypothetical protein